MGRIGLPCASIPNARRSTGRSGTSGTSIPPDLDGRRESVGGGVHADRVVVDLRSERTEHTLLSRDVEGVASIAKLQLSKRPQSTTDGTFIRRGAGPTPSPRASAPADVDGIGSISVDVRDGGFEARFEPVVEAPKSIELHVARGSARTLPRNARGKVQSTVLDAPLRPRTATLRRNRSSSCRRRAHAKNVGTRVRSCASESMPPATLRRIPPARKIPESPAPRPRRHRASVRSTMAPRPAPISLK